MQTLSVGNPATKQKDQLLVGPALDERTFDPKLPAKPLVLVLVAVDSNCSIRSSAHPPCRKLLRQKPTNVHESLQILSHSIILGRKLLAMTAPAKGAESARRLTEYQLAVDPPAAGPPRALSSLPPSFTRGQHGRTRLTRVRQTQRR